MELPKEEKVKSVAPEDSKKVDTVVQSKMNKLIEESSKSSKIVPNSGGLVKGSLKVGATAKACCINIDETKNPPVPYISYSSKSLSEITSMISNMKVSIESQAIVSSIDVGDIVFAKSKDDNSWYRSIVERVGVEDLDVYFFDWGMTETLDLSRIRRLTVLELGLSNSPANALKVRINNPPGPLVDKFFECDSEFDIRVDSYDDFDDTYMITLIGVAAK